MKKKRISKPQNEPKEYVIPRRKRGFRFDSYGIGAGIGIAVFFVFTALFAVLLAVSGLSPETAHTFGILSIGAGCVAGGIFIGAAKWHGGFPRGMLVSLIIISPVIVFSFINGNIDGLLEKMITGVFCGGLGGVIGVNK
jgi:putative membrane protein (TIGR04086 family)